MSRHAPFLLAIAALAALGSAGCGGSWRASPERVLDGNGVGSAGGATIVSAEELHRSNGSVLRAIMGKVPNMKVSFRDMGRCPSIAIRSFEDHYGNDFPGIYVDGTHVRDTCVLETLDARDAERVEVYPAGFTTRPGYASNNNGLILVFLRRN
ncbi:MAG TPA: Plug domain-containing protein [Longimicrobiales bacterium]|nr:Plug domain-containing protein [Longimicrobiales bacterium]